MHHNDLTMLGGVYELQLNFATDIMNYLLQILLFATDIMNIFKYWL